MTSNPMAAYHPTIEEDNAVSGLKKEEAKEPTVISGNSSLPEVNAVQGSGKTIRVNAGKSYLESGVKKPKSKVGSAIRTSAVKRTGRP